MPNIICVSIEPKKSCSKTRKGDMVVFDNKRRFERKSRWGFHIIDDSREIVLKKSLYLHCKHFNYYVVNKSGGIKVVHPTFRVIRQSCSAYSLSLKYRSSLNPYAFRFITFILLLIPSTLPVEITPNSGSPKYQVSFETFKPKGMDFHFFLFSLVYNITIFCKFA